MSNVDYSYFTDAIKDIKHHKSLLNLQLAHYGKEDEVLHENLSVAVDYLQMAIQVLNSIVSHSKGDRK